MTKGFERSIRPFRIALAISLLAVGNTCTGAPSYARNFDLTEHDTHRVLVVRNLYRGSTDEIRYALVPREAPLPNLPPDMTVIRTPVQRVVTMETVHVGFLDALGRTEAIVGAATTDAISHAGVRERVRKGEIRRIEAGRNIDVEALLLLEPDLILTTVLGDPAFDLPPKLTRAGLPVVITAGYMEDHPLARAEWIKFVAAFFDEETRAGTFFDEIAGRYLDLQETASAATERRSVFCGAPFSGTWYVPGGQSFSARFIEDAGGAYVWADDDSRGGIPLDTERVFLKAGEADIWLNPGRYRKLAELLTVDQRFAKFQAFSHGAVFNRTRPAAGSKGSAIWERGVARPDEVLADHVRILQPDLLPDHTLLYYERLQ